MDWENHKQSGCGVEVHVQHPNTFPLRNALLTDAGKEPHKDVRIGFMIRAYFLRKKRHKRYS
jgi:hypothetical protein